MQIKGEKIFLQRIYEHKDKIEYNDSNAVMEGFEYLHSDEYRSKPGAVKSRARRLLSSHGLKETLRLGNHMRKIFPSMMKNIKMNYSDMDGYLNAMESGEAIPKTPDAIISAYPNEMIWEELKNHVRERYRLIVGFTEVPSEYIFMDKGIPFKYALVFAQEMNKDAIEKAPALDAGMEVAKVYNSLGIATNEINHWLREKFGIVGMANHPLGGLVDFIPLAEKAGLGMIGRNGLLITKEFGPRCRISPIFIDTKLFNDTKTNEHDWIRLFCKNCGNCSRNCPENAIYEQASLSVEYHNEEIEDRYEAFDREKCFQSFSAHMGCSVCIKVCPFSRNPQMYHQMSKKFKREEADA